MVVAWWWRGGGGGVVVVVVWWWRGEWRGSGVAPPLSPQPGVRGYPSNECLSDETYLTCIGGQKGGLVKGTRCCFPSFFPAIFLSEIPELSLRPTNLVQRHKSAEYAPPTPPCGPSTAPCHKSPPN